MKNLLHTGLFAASLVASSAASAAFVQSPTGVVRQGQRAERLIETWEHELDDEKSLKTTRRSRRVSDERRDKAHQEHRRGVPPKRDRFR